MKNSEHLCIYGAPPEECDACVRANKPPADKIARLENRIAKLEERVDMNERRANLASQLRELNELVAARMISRDQHKMAMDRLFDLPKPAETKREPP